MRFAIAVPAMYIVDGKYRFDPLSFVAECCAAEKAGFHTAVVGERRVGVTAYCTSTTVLAGLALANTKSLSFCPMVIQLPLRSPVDVIQDACVLNAAYPNRYRLGVGAGYNEHEFALLDVPMTARGRLMDEGLQAMNRFRNGEISVDLGRGIVPAMDPALGDCRPEIWVGAWTEKGVIRTAREADGWLVDPMRTISAVESLASVYREACEEYGRRPRISLLREAWIAESDQLAREEFAPHLVHAHSEYFPRMRGGWKDKASAASQPYDLTLDSWVAQMNSKEDLDFRNLVDDRILVGSAATWHRLLADWHKRIGFEELVLRLRFQSGPSPKQTLRAIDEIGSLVIPAWLDKVPE